MPTFQNTVSSIFVGRYLHIPAYESGTDRVFRNVGIYNSDAEELPGRKHTTFGTLRKFEIKKSILSCTHRYISGPPFNRDLFMYINLYIFVRTGVTDFQKKKI
jgi:hypothetical protein